MIMIRYAVLIGLMLNSLAMARGSGGTPRDGLVALLTSVYPNSWSGSIRWSWEDDPENLTMLAEVSFPRRQFITCDIAFDGTCTIHEVSDDQMRIRFRHGVPFVFPRSYAPLLKEAPAFVYAFLRQPDQYTVSLDTERQVYLVDGLADAYIVRFSVSDGHVISATNRYDGTLIEYADYQVIADCLWPTRCRVTDSTTSASFELVADVTPATFPDSHFDYKRFYSSSTRDSNGNGIVMYRGEEISESDARGQVWPESTDEWNLRETLAELSQSGASRRSSASVRPLPGDSGITARSVFFAGLILASFGLVCLGYKSAVQRV